MRFRLIPLLCALLLLHGCAAPLVIAGGAAITGVMVAKDRRSVGTMLDDQAIELKVQQQLTADAELLDNSHINITSYNGVVLLSGEALLPLYKQRIEQIVRQQNKVREVHNAVEIGPLSDASSRKRDIQLTARLKSRLVADEKLDAVTIKVVTERGNVYLMGLVSHQEAELAVKVARSTKGVVRIVKVFEYSS
ncbi:MAG: BON domain-containing protein [Gammaproteobacteria bacterium]|nr:BON domain-containing protein [Gammaproteobacteria bacterium]MCW8840067.1 BON domain-containing protein [Gammaproteobacteria bacterium]MCW8927593.1 BON domain-containing protein [Gammaproteobacteria bacterium]MCW8959719.1 BON domain-containing protein [Gammaproteobacteria bacterium]MCW8971916.1 BON domain-containing protein [Gammaproteobacteria bacterium]